MKPKIVQVACVIIAIFGSLSIFANVICWKNIFVLSGQYMQQVKIWPDQSVNVTVYLRKDTSVEKPKGSNKEPRILCWISTWPGYKLKSEAVRATWGKKCDKFLIMSSANVAGYNCPNDFPRAVNWGRTCCSEPCNPHDDRNVDEFYCQYCPPSKAADCPSFVKNPKQRCGNYTDLEIPEYIYLNVSSDYESLWQKTIEAFQYIWYNHADKFDFVLKADDDTFVNMSNLKKFLNGLDEKDKLYIGHALSRRTNFFSEDSQNFIWMSGGAGYVLSRASVHVFIRYLAQERNYLPRLQMLGEDTAMGWIMADVGASFVHAVSEEGGPLFLPVEFSRLKSGIFDQSSKWFTQLTFDSGWKSYLGLSQRPQQIISEHYVQPWEMFYLNSNNITSI